MGMEFFTVLAAGNLPNWRGALLPLGCAAIFLFLVLSLQIPVSQRNPAKLR